ncbi:MAG: hypothetical protein ACRDP4_00180 [Nocardioidaceae bacterium]
MGPYCQFCDRRCFVPNPYSADIRAAILATCPAGIEHDRHHLGYGWPDVRPAQPNGRSRTHAATLAIRRQLFVVIQQATQPVTTTEACHLAEPRRVIEQHDSVVGELSHRFGDSRNRRLVCCDGANHVVELSLVVDRWGYWALRHLEATGLVARVRDPGRREVAWVYTGEPESTPKPAVSGSAASCGSEELAAEDAEQT